MMDQAESNYLFQLLSSAITISDQTIILDQSAIADVFVATLTINSTTIQNCTSYDNAFQITSSQLISDGLTISNYTNYSTYQSLIYATLESTVNVNNFVYRDSDSQVFILQSSKCVLNNFTVSNVWAWRYFARIEQ